MVIVSRLSDCESRDVFSKQASAGTDEEVDDVAAAVRFQFVVVGGAA